MFLFQLLVMFVNLKKNGVQKQCKIGFSWSYLFLLFLVPLWRGDIKWAVISVILMPCTLTIGNWILMFIYNKIYVKELLEKGWEPASDVDKNFLVKKGIMLG